MSYSKGTFNFLGEGSRGRKRLERKSKAQSKTVHASIDRHMDWAQRVGETPAQRDARLAAARKETDTLSKTSNRTAYSLGQKKGEGKGRPFIRRMKRRYPKYNA